MNPTEAQALVAYGLRHGLLKPAPPLELSLNTLLHRLHTGRAGQERINRRSGLNTADPNYTRDYQRQRRQHVKLTA